MKQILISLLLFSRLGASTLLTSPRRLGADFQRYNFPFELPAQKHLQITTSKWTGSDQVIRRGLVFTLAERGSPAEKVKDKLSKLQSVIPFSNDPLFLKQALHIFSKPYIDQAVFLEWTDKSGRVWKKGSDHPDRVQATIDGPNYQQLSLTFYIDSADTTDPPYYLTIKKALGSPFVMAPEVLKEALCHVTGKNFADWTISQLATKLAHDPNVSKFYLRVPRNENEVMAASKQHLEFYDSNWVQVRETFDPATQVLIQSRTDNLKHDTINIVSTKIKRIEFWHPKVLYLSIPRWSITVERPASPATLPVELIQDVVYRLIGHQVSPFCAQRIAEFLSQEQRISRVNFLVDPDVDSRIWELLKTSAKDGTASLSQIKG